MKRQIVVGVDGSAVSIAALRWAIEEAARRGSTVTAVNEAGHGVEITELLLEGQPGPALVEAAAEADLLVVGSRLYEALLGSVSSHCVHHSHCPVVIIPDVHRKHEKTAVVADALPLTMGPLL